MSDKLEYWNGSAWVPLKLDRTGKALTWEPPDDWEPGGQVEIEEGLMETLDGIYYIRKSKND